MPETRAERVPIRADILTHEVTESDEVVIYDSEDRQLLVLNDLGAGIWLLIDGRRSLADLTKELLQSVQADPATVEGDVADFVEQLVARKVVRWREP
jgi:hypothetical protein